MARKRDNFQTIHSEGGLLPSDLLRRVLDPKEKIPGTKPEDYSLSQGERINDVITQSWNRLQRHWVEFREAANKLPEGEPSTGLTNEKWSLPILRELGFGLVPTSPGPEINGRTYAINRFWGATAIHLVGCGLSLDRRAVGVRGAASVNPHGLVQDFLNRSSGHLWAMVSNGLRFRILRDSQALSRQSYLEFDLEAMFAGEVFPDFVLFWLFVHATRFNPHEEGRPETCWLEQWTKLAEEQGTRALESLRGGVEKALQVLGQGFVGHPRNTALREVLRSGKVSLNDFHGQLLRIVYRLIFLFVAEDRTLDGISVLHPRDESEQGRQARERYTSHYSTARLRELASHIKGSRHGDLWQQLNLLVGALSGEDRFSVARQQLALPALGSMLWATTSTVELNASSLTNGDGTELSNFDFLEALRHLAFTQQNKMLRPVDYKNLGSEELGGVYESLLALTPQISGDGARFTFAEFAGNERKTSGSFYTHDSLVQCLLDSALDPVVEEAIKGKTGNEAEKAILALKVCDPAVGSGHFLVGAAHRLARHLARVRALAQGESEPSPILYQHALRDVIGYCLYGVDINPMAAELCRVSLWLEALEPGKPLSFLDHHIRVGNSLLGATPKLIAEGIPDEAFNPIEGDDKKVCSLLKKRNKMEREGGQQDMIPLMVAEPQEEYNSIEQRMRGINDVSEDTIEDTESKAERFDRLLVSPEYKHSKQIADAWCATFVWKKQAGTFFEPITTDTIRRLEANPMTLTHSQHGEVERLTQQYHFFHWYLSFPEVFAQGGFDCVLGNPPWEHTELKEKEWFAERRPDIANARTGAERKRMIESLKRDDPFLYATFVDSLRLHDGASHFYSASGCYSLCGRGRINLYAVFAEGMRNLLNSRGRVGCVLPTGIATDDTTKYFFQDVIDTRSLISIFDFENRERTLFPDVYYRMRFCLFTSGRGLHPITETAEFAFLAYAVDDLKDPHRRFSLSAKEIELLNPNTRTCPVFHLRSDAELTKAMYRRTPVLVREIQGTELKENPWNIRIRRIFNMGLSEISSLSRIISQLSMLNLDDSDPTDQKNIREGEYLPMLEGKMFDFYNHRAAGVLFNPKNIQRGAQAIESTSEDLANPYYSPQALFWFPQSELIGVDPSRFSGRWVLGFKDITSVTNERTMVAAILPFAATNFTIRVVQFQGHVKDSVCILFISILNSLAFDYLIRQSLAGLHVSDYITHQVPVLPPTIFNKSYAWAGIVSSIDDWFERRVLELTYTAWELELFAQDCGWSGPPFRWDEDRRFLLRCELDAAFFLLYLLSEANGEWQQVEGETEEEMAQLKTNFPTPRDAIEYIIETFTIVKYRDEAAHGRYRTKDTILEIYDALVDAMRTGKPYITRLDPPPGPPEDGLPEWKPGQPRPMNWPSHVHAPKGCS